RGHRRRLVPKVTGVRVGVRREVGDRAPGTGTGTGDPGRLVGDLPVGRLGEVGAGHDDLGVIRGQVPDPGVARGAGDLRLVPRLGLDAAEAAAAAHRVGEHRGRAGGAGG